MEFRAIIRDRFSSRGAEYPDSLINLLRSRPFSQLDESEVSLIMQAHKKPRSPRPGLL